MDMNRLLVTLLAACTFAGFTSQAFTQGSGDAKRGRDLARSSCAQCHAITRGQLRSRNGFAPTFEALATGRAATRMALREALQNTHREMPNLILNDDQLEDLAAYIASLR
jgi:mono/diheme cytochrome c family protein